ncbi:helix-turn-helix transcriptional regulator [Clostridium sp.]|uniref:helix-turn-helix domain-containing protein n=1 Tax=Clostridium sp. TaxID=1506 RepID=UPI003217075A
MDTQKIGRFIAEARKNKKMTQAEFGEYLNVTDKSVSKWECGKCMPDSSLFEGISKVLEVSVNELLKGEYIEQENEEVENNKNTILLLNEIQKLKRNESLVGGLCALLISFITVIYSAIYKPGIKAYEQFFAGFIKAISAGCLVIGILLIFNAWVKYSIRNSNKDKR